MVAAPKTKNRNINTHGAYFSATEKGEEPESEAEAGAVGEGESEGEPKSVASASGDSVIYSASLPLRLWRYLLPPHPR